MIPVPYFNLRGLSVDCPLYLVSTNDCSSEELFAPDCYDQNRRSDFQGCVEDHRYPYRAIYSAVMRLSIFILTYYNKPLEYIIIILMNITNH